VLAHLRCRGREQQAVDDGAGRRARPVAHEPFGRGAARGRNGSAAQNTRPIRHYEFEQTFA
jgi:hypothetical protein